MRTRTLIFTTLVAGGALAACSGPSGKSAAEADRHLLLAKPAAPDSGVVSDLEAGRRAKPAVAEVVVRSRGTAPKSANREAILSEVLTPGGHDHAVVSEVVPLRETAIPSLPTVEVTRAVEPAPESEGPALGTVWHGHGNMAMPSSEAGRIGGGPQIMIRGGRGGPDDDCDLRNVLHPRGGGAAVNRTTPSFGGYGRSRAGIR